MSKHRYPPTRAAFLRIEGVNISLRWLAKEGIPKPSLTRGRKVVEYIWPHGYARTLAK